MEICSKITGYKNLGSEFILNTNCADIKLYFLTDEIIRVRASFNKEFAEESYILSLTAWADRLDELFKGERTRVEPAKFNFIEDDSALKFSTKKLTLEINKDSINIKLFDAEGTELYSSLAGNPFTLDSNKRITHYSRMNEDDCFYGFGEKAGVLNKNKEFLRERATDAMGYDPVKFDTLYKHVPFYIKLDRNNKKALGIFYHNSGKIIHCMSNSAL